MGLTADIPSKSAHVGTAPADTAAGPEAGALRIQSPWCANRREAGFDKLGNPRRERRRRGG